MKQKEHNKNELPPLAVLASTITSALQNFSHNIQQVPGTKFVSNKVSGVVSKSKSYVRSVPLVAKVSKSVDAVTKKTPLIRNVRKGIEVASQTKHKK